MSEEQIKRFEDLFNKIIEAREAICNDFCKYTSKEYVGLLTQEALSKICEGECPLSKL